MNSKSTLPPGIDQIMFLGDIHGDIDVMIQAMKNAANIGISTIIQVGDFWLYQPHEIAEMAHVQECLYSDYGILVTVHFIDGNHEDFRVIDPHGPVQELSRNLLYYHPRGSVFTVHGVNIACFGGAVSIDQDYRVEGISWFPEEFPSTSDIHRAKKNFHDIDVLITHEIPEFAINQVTDADTLKEIHNSHIVRHMIDEVAGFANAPLMVHGHWHIPSLENYGDNSVLSLGLNGGRGSMCVVNEHGNVTEINRNGYSPYGDKVFSGAWNA